MKVRTILRAKTALPQIFPSALTEGAGRRPGDGAEDLGKIIVISDPYCLRDCGDSQAALQQKQLRGVDPALGDKVIQRLAPGQLLGQAAQLSPPDVELGRDGFQRDRKSVV